MRIPFFQRNASTVEPAGLHALRLASDIISRAGFARSNGKTFGGKRDLYDALGYARSLSPADFRSRYERGDIAAGVVDAYPKETWKDGPELIENEDPKVLTPWEEAFRTFVERLSLWAVCKRADTLCGLGPYSVILIGAAGRLEEELPPLRSLDDVLYLAPYGADDAKILTWEEQSDSPRFGLPTSYQMRRASGVNRVAHWTRIIHVADNLLDDRVNGIPLLQRVWNRLDDLDKVVGGGSEAFWLRVHQGTIFSVDKDVKIEDAQLQKLKDTAEEFAHGLRRTIAARGFEATQLNSDVSNFGSQVDSLISLISGATGIPQRILLGSERGELASSQDSAAWTDRIAERRRDFAAGLIKQVVERLTAVGAMMAVEMYDIRWPDSEEMSETEKAAVAEKWAKLNSLAGGVVVTAAEIRDRVLRLDPLDEATLAKLEQERLDREDAAAEAAALAQGDRRGPMPAENMDA